MIKKFIHGDPETDEKLFCMIGKLVVNPKLHNELGSAITSLPGDLWYLYLNKEEKVVEGFCQVRQMKNGHWHLRFLYAGQLGIKTRNALIDRAIRDAKAAQAVMIYTNDRETSGIWKLFNFVPYEKQRGSFVRWEKDL